MGNILGFSDTIPMAPVVYMPAATMNRAPMVSIPALENPRRHSSSGVKRNVITSVSAPIKMAAGGNLVLISKANNPIRIARVA